MDKYEVAEKLAKVFTFLILTISSGGISLMVLDWAGSIKGIMSMVIGTVVIVFWMMFEVGIATFLMFMTNFTLRPPDQLNPEVDDEEVDEE